MSCMLACAIALGLNLGAYSDTIETSYGASLSIGDPVSVWASYDQSDRYERVGQTMGKLGLPGVGVAYSPRINERTRLRFAVGRWWPQVNPSEDIRDEVVNTTLIGDHGDRFGRADSFLYEMRDGIGFEFGLEHAATDRLSFNFKIRLLKVREVFSMCQPAVEPCVYRGVVAEDGRMWLNHDNTSLSSAHLGLKLRF